MNNFLKRNRMIKLFTIGWIFLMAVIAAFLLLRVPSIDDRDIEAILISGENKQGMSMIEALPSTLLNQVVIVQDNFSMKAVVLTLMSDNTYEFKIYKFEVWEDADRNSNSHADSINILFGSNDSSESAGENTNSDILAIDAASGWSL